MQIFFKKSFWLRWGPAPQLSCPLVPPRQALPRSLPTASTPPSPRAGRHDFFRDDPQWIRKPDPPSTDRSLRSAEDAGSAPDGSFAPRMQIYPDSALPPAHTNAVTPDTQYYCTVLQSHLMFAYLPYH
ncbi:hypothetical protein T4D_7160 [Trichinella pseudospiralis]|uniref:Uncharacterized protein n=1 Tax=Trichinella pseudospiralis TaxID=6337 RepID=A0A0V1FF19_TRIPS|nr:hypothetical protein T4D_1901 [Trichinella pseudospiralis]KRY84637.1 hypothetical protein T4D_7160 [Trichinella pseudospiralis]